MPTWHDRDIQQQFGVASRNGWLDHFKKYAGDYDFTADMLMAIASRETNMRSIVGDGGHGYGIMQIDDRSFPDWCHSGMWRDVKSCIQKGAIVLDGKREQIRNGQGKNLKVGGMPFRGASNLSDGDLTRIAIAAYNAGLWAYYSFSKNRDPDAKTTHKDYSSDVLSRAAVFRNLMP